MSQELKIHRIPILLCTYYVVPGSYHRTVVWFDITSLEDLVGRAGGGRREWVGAGKGALARLPRGARRAAAPPPHSASLSESREGKGATNLGEGEPRRSKSKQPRTGPERSDGDGKPKGTH